MAFEENITLRARFCPSDIGRPTRFPFSCIRPGERFGAMARFHFSIGWVTHHGQRLGYYQGRSTGQETRQRGSLLGAVTGQHGACGAVGRGKQQGTRAPWGRYNLDFHHSCFVFHLSTTNGPMPCGVNGPHTSGPPHHTGFFRGYHGFVLQYMFVVRLGLHH